MLQGLLGGEFPWLYPISGSAGPHDVLYTLESVLTTVKPRILIERALESIGGPLMSPTTLFCMPGLAGDVQRGAGLGQVYPGW